MKELSKYHRLYEICMHKLTALLEKEHREYRSFLADLSISVITDSKDKIHYLMPVKHLNGLIQKELTKEEVSILYKTYRDENKTA